jgi:molybdenum cofactor cytidylyltransferase
MAASTAVRESPLGVVILGAGASSRMGRPKLLLPWGETSVLGHLIGRWQGLRARQVVVVCAVNDLPIQQELDRLRFPSRDRILNPAPEAGMMSSIRCAAGWTGWSPVLTHWAIVLGDQPHVRPETLRAVIDFAAAHPNHICQPAHNGRPRHPVILPAAAFHRLAAAAEATLKEFLSARAAARACCELDDPGLDLDLDEPADYERALALAGVRRREVA